LGKGPSIGQRYWVGYHIWWEFRPMLWLENCKISTEKKRKVKNHKK